MKKVLMKIISGEIKNPNTGNRVRIDQVTQFLKKYYKEIYNELKGSELKGSQWVYNIINDIYIIPKCPICGNNRKFNTFNLGYKEFCGQTCQIKSLHAYQEENGWFFKKPEVLEKIKENNIKKYGVEYPFQSKEYQRHMEEKYFEKTGFKKSSQNKEVSNKIALGISKSYQYNFNAEDDYAGVVYILLFDEGVKIGRTFDFNIRCKALKKDFGNFNIIKLIKSNNIKKLEKEIHLEMDEYRIVLNEGSGRTEFFKKEILELGEFKKWLK